jgi:hypothetical protein
MHYAHSSYCWCCCYSVVEANDRPVVVQCRRRGRLGWPPAGCCPESDGIHSKSIGDSACTGTHSLRRVQELGLVKPSASQAPLVVSLVHDSIGLVEQQQQCMHDSGDRRRKNASSAQYFHVLNPESLLTGSEELGRSP